MMVEATRCFTATFEVTPHISDERKFGAMAAALFSQLGLPLLNSVFASSSTSFTRPE
jgi:hypothetical protein